MQYNLLTVLHFPDNFYSPVQVAVLSYQDFLVSFYILLLLVCTYLFVFCIPLHQISMSSFLVILLNHRPSYIE